MSNNEDLKQGYIDPKIKEQIISKLKKDEILVGIFNYDEKHYMIVTQKSLINWNRTALFGKFNRIKFNRITFVENSKSVLFLTIDGREYDYQGFRRNEIAELVELVNNQIEPNHKGRYSDRSTLKGEGVKSAEHSDNDWRSTRKFKQDEDQLFVALKLAAIHWVMFLIYLIFIFYILDGIGRLIPDDIIISLSFTDGIVAFILMMIFASIPSYIFAMSYSNQFACRIGAFHALRIGWLLAIELLFFALVAVIIGWIPFIFTLEYRYEIAVLISVIYSLFIFYYVQGWILKNQDDSAVSNSPNRNYWNFHEIKHLF